MPLARVIGLAEKPGFWLLNGDPARLDEAESVELWVGQRQLVGEFPNHLQARRLVEGRGESEQRACDELEVFLCHTHTIPVEASVVKHYLLNPMKKAFDTSGDTSWAELAVEHSWG